VRNQGAALLVLALIGALALTIVALYLLAPSRTTTSTRRREGAGWEGRADVSG